MLTIRGAGGKFCDGLSRRQFLTVGALGGLALPQLLAAEAHAGIRSSHKAVILIYLPGGPSHQDTFDLKMDAPSDIRGEFKPIKTNVPGIEICEHLPRLAKMMDKVAVIRSLVGARDEHSSNLCLSGYTEAEFRQNKAPTMGSVLARLEAPVDKTVPSYVNLAARTQHPPYNDPGPGFLGPGYGALNPNGPMLADMTLTDVSLDRLSHRKQLLASLDRYRRRVDTLPELDTMSARAFDILTSSKLVQALDVSREDVKTRERYGKGIDKPQGDASPMLNEQFLAARRLVEAGARLVSVSYGFWDWHGGNFTNMKAHLPVIDQGISALIEDLHQRGLDKDVSVVVWGDFGRSPKINKDGGRDHWPRVSCALLAGGGMKTGQVIGSTNKFGEEPDECPVDYKEVMVTLYHNLGIDIANTPVPDMTGRPNYLFAGREPLPELI
ncbi:DUF1501 domain-containing protein [Armatimonas rosea]|uniref:DUF1501 domain-containing protein n=1 Tax=Armatimonas rosea TaxID=685828 RepID=A0A7W9SL55_ARMRO|nr:DUF1501 domain-containing protein [Armatimonas rosea]MBB6048657.1 hypothetical protein [Armatimonas rosea]